ncbi:hypothetical protein, unlikely [Trypanosoma brucei gambiense DAL972]|uniref:Uncharacterized protein n=1 Tax=Trypanosoma brucei gambiense (strain MHOM/CI/86/DAL972) TaxID=679716 RepID=C9ZMW9_TRYB9|nr:hypothetical protein, unlikely [Trypanosoma brucei gambiense DAL972]CBH10622.1 hypothetical protein, unlikely [Trypanosoma brucei gambiense DAL972]|eukprot:XP_011772911.1 hypothetical protein, unlikely [Trypanosoma brucei gambiense DAL972]
MVTRSLHFLPHIVRVVPLWLNTSTLNENNSHFILTLFRFFAISCMVVAYTRLMGTLTCTHFVGRCESWTVFGTVFRKALLRIFVFAIFLPVVVYIYFISPIL